MKRRLFIAAGLGVAASPLVFLRKGSEEAPVAALSELLPDGGDTIPVWQQIDPMQDREVVPLSRILRPAEQQEPPQEQLALASEQVDLVDDQAELADDQSQEAQNMDSRDSQTMAVNARNQAQVIAPQPGADETLSSDDALGDIDKSIYFAHDFIGDIYVSEANQAHLQAVFQRLKRLQNTIGFGNFNIVSFDQALSYAKSFSQVGAFTQEELDFIDELFAFNSADYGFYGDKVTANLTQSIKPEQVIKVPYTGHYLFKDQSLAYYEKLKKDVGENIILTSGIRSNVKQLYLFLAKTVSVDGNLSRASRSLAPPGYSYHGIGDFDVGRVGWGARNFTGDFAETDEFKKMQDLGYIAIRYDQGNKLGVRFEPWHIQVV
ncbi:M15 family metallopeptidase [Halioxenophilus aromaticivorans]|uniref:D-alanyl-D-alanine carboxypeptidase-like core domain-containing protein n=1 Tax=Halioxenophilus aromaticivorans TaxID=1306992 RepID=A0AAV3U9F5_9ALTE